MDDVDKKAEIDKLKSMAKQYENAYMKCLGIIEYLEKDNTENKVKKKDK
mgnify:CR=1 FL=1|tara:strand:+ start:350 stop:496 length:147 start_codon:yes stop_codon:yes gene_type:complete